MVVLSRVAAAVHPAPLLVHEVSAVDICTVLLLALQLTNAKQPIVLAIEGCGKFVVLKEATPMAELGQCIVHSSTAHPGALGSTALFVC